MLQGEHSAILSTFIKLPFVIKIFVLSIFKWPLKTGLFVDALWSPAGKGLNSWLSFVMSNCDVVTFPLVSWVRCGA